MADDDGVIVVVQQNGVASDSDTSSQQLEQEPAEERELTLTDHLNKRLLESFMNRLDDGSFQVPASATSASHPIPEESDDFDDS